MIETNHPIISAVSPIYGSEATVKDLYSRLSKSLQEITDNY
jgi:hypothetical protein